MSDDSILNLCTPHWGVATEGSVYPIGDTLWMYRITSTDTPKKSVLKYEDENVAFAMFYGKNERYLGFGLQVLVPGFVGIYQGQWVMLTDSSSRYHTHGTMSVLVDTTPLRMIRILNDGKIGRSYQVSTRRQDTGTYL